MRLARLWPPLSIGAIVALGVLCLAAALGPHRSAGFLTYQSGAVAPLARAEWAGFRAGLRVRDVVVSADLAPVHGGRDLAARVSALPDGATIHLVVRSPSGAERALALPVGRLSAADLAYTFALPFSIGVLYLLLGAAVFWLKRDQASALVLVLCLVAAAFYLTLFDTHTGYRFARVWVCYPLLGPLSVHLFAVFPERRPAWVRPRVLAALYLTAAAAIVWRQLTLDDARHADQAALGSSIMLAAEFLIDLGLLWTAFRSARSPVQQKRAKTTFLGMALSVSVVVAWQFAARVPSLSSVMTAERAMVCSAAFPLLIAYALLTRDLLDIDAVLRASAAYGLATAGVLGLYFAAAAVLGAVVAPLARRYAPGLDHPGAAAAVSTLMAAALFHPLRMRAQRLVDALYGGQARAIEELAALAAEPPAGGEPAAVAEDVARRLQRLAGARAVALLSPEAGRLTVTALQGPTADGAAEARIELGSPLCAALEGESRPRAVRDLPPETTRDSEAALALLPSELLLPLRARGQLIALAALGPRRAGVYRYAELRALAQAAPSLALALDHARLAAERAARERLAALGAMAAVIVHEVKNPLGIIKVSAGSLRRRAADEASAELARCVEDEVDRMDAVCRRLLDLARPPAPAFQPCDVGQVIRRTLDRLAPDLDAARVSVSCQLGSGAAGPATVLRADPTGLEHMLANLLYNARDSMLPDGGQLEVRLEPSAGQVAICVADSGRGMDESTRRQLFRPFFTTRHGGTGLGLAIVKRIVEEHHGAVQVESRPGAGARFTITLPTRLT